MFLFKNPGLKARYRFFLKYFKENSDLLLDSLKTVCVQTEDYVAECVTTAELLVHAKKFYRKKEWITKIWDEVMTW
jgi:hypothetical protein